MFCSLTTTISLTKDCNLTTQPSNDNTIYKTTIFLKIETSRILASWALQVASCHAQPQLNSIQFNSIEAELILFSNFNFHLPVTHGAPTRAWVPVCLGIRGVYLYVLKVIQNTKYELGLVFSFH